MQRSIASLAASALLVALLGVAAPAHAGFATFVSGDGSDAATCLTPATACREIFGASGALSKTDEGGIIHVLPGEYIAFNVNKGIDIVADAGQASIFSTVAGAGGIVVDVSGNQVVRIRGFLINSAHGIVINGSGVVHIEDSTLLGVEGRFGILYQPTGAGELYVSGTTLSRPTIPAQGGGILIKPQVSGSAKVVLNNVEVRDNTSGVIVDGRQTTGTTSATLRNSVVSGSTGNGVFAADSGAGSTTVMIEESAISHNGANGIIASATNTTVRVRNSTITGNAKGLAPGAGSKIVSQGGNVVDGNTVNGAFTSTVGQL